MVRTRIAPSPTGFAHVGTAYTALFNYAFARKNKGKFILRLEDTDVKRNVPGAEEAIYAGLSWLGISWDEGPDVGGKLGPYKDSEKLEIYKKYAEQLVGDGKAYKDEGAIRFKNPGDDVSWDDLVRGKVTFPGGEVTDFVIMKGDGYPTYNFGVVVDDIEMKITHVIRGEEHISNTPRQIALYHAFDQKPPEFAHLPTLRNEKHQKLSKRRDPVDLRLFREQGYLPQALVNFLCLLGWSHPEEKEIFDINEFIDKFTLERVRKAGPVFDWKKLEWINGEYIRRKDDEELAYLFWTHLKDNDVDISIDFVKQLVPLIKNRVHTLKEAMELVSFFWEEPVFPDKQETIKELFDPQAQKHLASALHVLQGIKKWTLENINVDLEREIKERGYKTGEFYMTVRAALSGAGVTPPINESMVILGQDKVLHRLEDAQKILIGNQ